MSATEHALRGTYQPARHGPLPAGVVPVPTVRRLSGVARGVPTAAPVPAPAVPMAVLTAADCPAVLTAEGRALWAVVVAQRPTDKLLGAFVAVWIEARLAWERATEQIKTGDIGEAVNPYLKLRRDAETSMLNAAKFMNLQPVAVSQAPPVEVPKSKFELFIMSRGKAKA